MIESMPYDGGRRERAPELRRGSGHRHDGGTGPTKLSVVLRLVEASGVGDETSYGGSQIGRIVSRNLYCGTTIARSDLNKRVVAKEVHREIEWTGGRRGREAGPGSLDFALDGRKEVGSPVRWDHTVSGG
jgi:hypothetical protein